MSNHAALLLSAVSGYAAVYCAYPLSLLLAAKCYTKKYKNIL
uniref:Uncharacterized protein n=1 Tax=Rheinheimera sp. BAL341 TaxID=1708203 RepID=A0A486XMZ9_9GAMM